MTDLQVWEECLLRKDEEDFTINGNLKVKRLKQTPLIFYIYNQDYYITQKKDNNIFTTSDVTQVINYIKSYV